MKHYLISLDPILNGAILPPKGRHVQFEKQDDGTYRSEPVDEETAQECSGIAQYIAYKEAEEADQPVTAAPQTSTTVKGPIPETGADGKPSDVNHPGGDPNGVRELSVSGDKARTDALKKAADEEEAKKAGEEAENRRRHLHGLPDKPEEQAEVPDGRGGMVKLNEPPKPPEAEGEVKVEGLSAEQTTPNENPAEEQRLVETNQAQDQATAGVVNYADAGIPTDHERAAGETPMAPPSPTVASARPSNPLPAYTVDEVKSPDMSKQAPKGDPSKAKGAAAAAADASKAGKPAAQKASNG